MGCRMARVSARGRLWELCSWELWTGPLRRSLRLRASCSPSSLRARTAVLSTVNASAPLLATTSESGLTTRVAQALDSSRSSPPLGTIDSPTALARLRSNLVDGFLPLDSHPLLLQRRRHAIHPRRLLRRKQRRRLRQGRMGELAECQGGRGRGVAVLRLMLVLLDLAQLLELLLLLRGEASRAEGLGEGVG